MAGHKHSRRLLECVEDNFLIQGTDKWSTPHVLLDLFHKQGKDGQGR